MRKAVLLSVNPRWCGLIASGKKTLEIRKSKPKLEVPFKVYIYCTKGRAFHFWRSKTYSYADDRSHNAFDLCGDGKIIGEFVCDRVYQYTTSNMTDGVDIEENEVISQSCLSRKELDSYEHSAEPKENCIYPVGLYCWHITDLKIYAQPKDLFITQGLKRAPQSWRYVEDGMREEVEKQMDVTLENVLRKHFGYCGVGVSGPDWVKAYQQMIDALYSIGTITGETDGIARVIGMLDKIDSQDEEI